MIALRCILLAACLLTGAAQLGLQGLEGPGTDGRFCGGYIGSPWPWSVAMRSKGIINFGDSSFPVAFNDYQIITTLQGGEPGRPVITKLTECMFDVRVAGASSIWVLAGPPAARPDQRRCWLLQTYNDVLLYQVKPLSEAEATSADPFSACPPGNLEGPPPTTAGSTLGGTITGILYGEGAALPTDPATDESYYLYSNACPPPANGAVAARVQGLDIRGPGLWVQPGFVAMTTDLREAGLGWQVSQACIVALKEPAGYEPLLLEGQIPLGLVVTSTASVQVHMVCIGLTFNVRAGLLLLKAGTTLPTFAEDGTVASGCPRATYADNDGIVPIAIRGLSAPFRTTVDAIQASLPTLLTTPLSQLRAETREVVETTLTMSAPAGLTVATATDPCRLFGIRVALAKAAGVDVETVKLTAFTLGHFSMRLAGDSLANLITAACPAPAQAYRLLHEEGADADTSASGGKARGLQTTALTAGVQIIVPPGQSSAQLATALAYAGGSTLQSIPSIISASFGVSLGSPTVSPPTVGQAMVLIGPDPPSQCPPGQYRVCDAPGVGCRCTSGGGGGGGSGGGTAVSIRWDLLLGFGKLLLTFLEQLWKAVTGGQGLGRGL